MVSVSEWSNEFSAYIAFGPGSSAMCTWHGVAVNCGPRGLPFSHHTLYRNDGRGFFTEVSKEAGIARVRPGS